VPADEIAAITARLIADQPVQDLTIEDPPIENVIEQAFHQDDATEAKPLEAQHA
jgi:ABC-2 type transport system ATP-binding protein